MAIKFNGTNQKAVVFNNVDQKRVLFNGKVIWCKPFILYISKGTGVSSVTVTRTSAEEPSASTGELSDRATIYYNDKLLVSATASNGYKIVSGTGSKTVTGDTSCSVTAEPALPVAPTISNVSTGGDPYARTATFTLKNNNPYTSVLYYEVSTSSGTVVGRGSTSAVSSGGTETVTKSLSSNGDYNIRVRASSELRYPDGSSTSSEWSGYSTATYTKIKLSTPTISDAYLNNALTGCWATIYNPNSVSCTISIDLYSPSEGDTIDTIMFDLAAKTSVNKKISFGGIYSSMRIYAMAEATYYESSSWPYVDLEYSGPEETTTTTR